MVLRHWPERGTEVLGEATKREVHILSDIKKGEFISH